jgi:hypothetical protein
MYIYIVNWRWYWTQSGWQIDNLKIWLTVFLASHITWHTAPSYLRNFSTFQQIQNKLFKLFISLLCVTYKSKFYTNEINAKTYVRWKKKFRSSDFRHGVLVTSHILRSWPGIRLISGYSGSFEIFNRGLLFQDLILLVHLLISSIRDKIFCFGILQIHIIGQENT